MEIVGLLLAGGRARRFGADKLLQPLPGGEPMAVVAWRNLTAGGADRNLVLVPPHRPRLCATLAAIGAGVQVCERAPLGMGETLACGVRATRDADAWVVALGDMPFIRPQTIAAVVDRLRGGAHLVVPRCAGRRGHPVGFATCFAPQLMALQGDVGARQLVREQARRIEWLDVDDRGILLDVDTPAELAAALDQ